MGAQRRTPAWVRPAILLSICLASFALMLFAALGDSATADEIAHIPAGYDSVHNLRYRTNPEHPPLIKILAALPLFILQPNFPVDQESVKDSYARQLQYGFHFLYRSGNDANAIIRTARMAPILLTLLTVVLIYALARMLMSGWWALVPAFLVAFDPTILAHGHLVTYDVCAAFGAVLAIWLFLKFHEAPTTKHLWWAGLGFGISQITKFSLPLLTVLFVFLTCVLWLRDRTRSPQGSASRFRDLFLILLIGYACVVYPVYFLLTLRYPIATQVSDAVANLAAFSGGMTPAGHVCRGIRCVADLDIWMARQPLLRPVAQYLLGALMTFHRATAGSTTYFLGLVSNSGGPLYFPILFLMKTPLPTLIIVLAGLVAGLVSLVDKMFGRTLRFDFARFAIAAFVVLYWAGSIRSPLNIGIRHIVPTLPFIYILAVNTLRKWFQSGALVPKAAAVALLLIWLPLETVVAAPRFLSYFNEFAGGTWNGYRNATDSNYDWGQDLLRLQAFVESHPEIDRIAVDYFGGGDQAYYLGPKGLYWASSKGSPAASGVHWLAVSIYQLENAIQPLATGRLETDIKRQPADSYSWLTSMRPVPAGMGSVPPPDFRVGTSIFVYRF